MNRRQFHHQLLAGSAAAALAGCTASAPPAPAAAGTGWPTPSLDALARAKGLRFGSTLGILPSGPRKASRFHDERYRALTAHECSVLVAENETKWSQLRPDPTRPYDFRMADEMFAWARGQGMALRGHTLMWVDPRWLPPWLAQQDFGAQPGPAMERLLAEHIGTVCRHFGTAIESWDVVNEAVDPASGEIRRNLFTERLGAVPHLARVFEMAREHAPQAELVYNDYMSWGADNERHRTGVLRLLAALKARGAPVQALGLQAHIGVWRLPPRAADGEAAAWRRFLDEVTGMGLKLLVTELDVNDRALPGDIAERDAGVAALARDWLDVTLDNRQLHRVLCWGLADHHSWLQDGGPRADGLPRRVAPYDEQLRPKPLRQAIADALRAAPARAAA
jgi:endo-1,4-beta-xylanase